MKITLQIFKVLQVNDRKMMVDVTRKTYYSLVAHQRIVGFFLLQLHEIACMYRNLRLLLPSNYKSSIGSVQNALLLQAKYLQCNMTQNAFHFEEISVLIVYNCEKLF